MTEATIPRWLKYDMAHREEKKLMLNNCVKNIKKNMNLR